MIEGLDTLLESGRDTGLRDVLVDVLGGPQARGRVIERVSLSRDRVFRWRVQLDDGVRSLVAKRMPVQRSLRERAAITSWLPRAGFGSHTAPLLGFAAQPHADRAWHVYADLGDRTLEQDPTDAREVRAAVELIARVHVHFAGNPFLAECRLVGADLGTGFFASALEDAVRGLEAMHRLEGVREDRRQLVDRLLDRLTTHRSEREERTHLLVELGWPETLQHGDLWLRNVLVRPGLSGPDIRLIDWEYAGVGPAIYDLSTLLRRFPPQDRHGVLDDYRAFVTRAGWSWPEDAALSRMAETMELARNASCVVWSALEALQAAPATTPDWVFDELAEIEAWFRDLTPLLLPTDETNPEVRAA